MDKIVEKKTRGLVRVLLKEIGNKNAANAFCLNDSESRIPQKNMVAAVTDRAELYWIHKYVFANDGHRRKNRLDGN